LEGHCHAQVTGIPEISGSEKQKRGLDLDRFFASCYFLFFLAGRRGGQELLPYQSDTGSYKNNIAIIPSFPFFLSYANVKKKQGPLVHKFK